jgi:hypothetical protein
MRWDQLGTDNFLAFDVEVDIHEAASLVHEFNPTYLVLRDSPTNEFDPPDSVYYLVPPEFFEWDQSTAPEDGITIRDRFKPQFGRIAEVVDTASDPITRPWRKGVTTTREIVVLGPGGVVASVVSSIGDEVDRAVEAARWGDTGARDLLEAVQIENLPQRKVAIPKRRIKIPSPIRRRRIADPQHHRGERAAPTDEGDGGGGGDGGNGGDLPGGMTVALKVSFPEMVELNTEASVLIRLTDRPDEPGGLPFIAAEGDRIDVIVSPVSGFSIVGKGEGTIEVTREGEPLAVQVKLRADTEGPGKVTVFAFRDQAPLGTVTILATVIAGSPTAGSSVTPLPIPATPRVEADLNLVILQESHQGGLAFRYVVSSADGRLNLRPFGPHRIDFEPGAYIHNLFEQIQEMPDNRGQWDGASSKRIERIGASLYELLVPEELQDIMWSIRDRISSVFIQTTEPWIPWELCRLSGRSAERIEEGPFLCELYDLSRWRPEMSMKTKLTARNVGFIAPRDADLAIQATEIAMLEALRSPGRAVVDISATYDGVLAAFGGGHHDVIHFTGHGENVDPSNAMRSELDLTGESKLRPDDISGTIKNLGRTNPLVFLNACQLGQASMGLHGIGGWAEAFINADAGAFLGSHWDVSDGLAESFAAKFYEEVLTGSTLAAAVRKARLDIRRDNDPTWLAYTLYAAPGASVT